MWVSKKIIEVKEVQPAGAVRLVKLHYFILILQVLSAVVAGFNSVNLFLNSGLNFTAERRTSKFSNAVSPTSFQWTHIFPKLCKNSLVTGEMWANQFYCSYLKWDDMIHFLYFYLITLLVHNKFWFYRMLISPIKEINNFLW